MKKDTKKVFDKSASELVKDAQQLRAEIAKMQLEQKTAPQKDTNLIVKKKKQLAVVLTVMNASRRDVGIPTRNASGKK